MDLKTLVLTPWMSPHLIVPWQQSACLTVTDKVDVLEEYDELVTTTRTAFRLPAVLRLKKPIQGYKKGVKFSRINVFTRDGFACQYCGTRKPMRDLNYDHVIPRIQGGKTDWDNIVTSCYPCNARKANRTPGQAGMMLLKKPSRPRTLPMTAPMLAAHLVPELWKPYLATQATAWALGATDASPALAAAG